MYSYHHSEDIGWKCNYSLAAQKIQYDRCVGRGSCTMFSTFPFKLLHMAERLQSAGIIAQIFAAARP